MEDSLPPLERCFGCYKYRRHLLRCSKCTCAYYCNQQCQADDWKVHKVFCGCLPPPASSSHGIRCLIKSYTVQGLLLPHDSATPRLVPVEIRPDGVINISSVDPHIPGGMNQIKVWMSEDCPPELFNNEEYQQGCGAFIMHNHYVTMDPRIPENVCTKTIMRGRAKSITSGKNISALMGKDYWKQLLERAKPWRGNVILLKTDLWKQQGKESPTFYDVEMKDVPDLVMIFWLYTIRISACAR